MASTNELMRQTAELEVRIASDVWNEQGKPMNDYAGELKAKGYDPRVVRTALWNLISSQKLIVKAPDARMHVEVGDYDFSGAMAE